MILWRSRGYADPEGEYPRSEVVCSIEKLTAGILLVEHGSNVQVDEMHASSAAARQKAERR